MEEEELRHKHFTFNLLSENARCFCYTEIKRIEKPENPLEFYKEYISQNKPVIIKGAIDDWPALKLWNNDYLKEKMGETEITVAVTPNGRADAICENHFVLPEERQMKFCDFVDKLGQNDDEILYVQTQNGCLTSEFQPLIPDVNLEFPLASHCFNAQPDAINFWMGEERSVSSMHKDPYENFYCVISGKKNFTLFPPTDAHYLPKEPFPQAQFEKNKESNEWKIKPTEPEQIINWITADPREIEEINPFVVTVHPGETLYLPALWFHEVRQEPDEEGKTIAVNFWYDMEYNFKWVLLDFIQQSLEKKRENSKKFINN